jgi:RNA polymerase sigma-70 factor (ECF subfamily)
MYNDLKHVLKLMPSDFELVSNLRNDDTKAFDMIYAKYGVNLYRFALKYLRSVEEAEELVQSVFMKIWEMRKSIKADTSFKSFLYTIVYNDMCNLFRKRKYNKEFVAETLYFSNHYSNETEERIDYKSILNRVELIIERLPEKHKIIFMKSRQEGKSTKEIAQEVGLSSGTVDNYISESLKYIKSKLKSESVYIVLGFMQICYFSSFLIK